MIIQNDTSKITIENRPTVRTDGFLNGPVSVTKPHFEPAVNHILIECPQFNLRQQYHFGSTLKELFSNTSVNDIIAFIKNTHFYTRI